MGKIFLEPSPRQWHRHLHPVKSTIYTPPLSPPVVCTGTGFTRTRFEFAGFYSIIFTVKDSTLYSLILYNVLFSKGKTEILKKMLKQQFLPYISLAGLAGLLILSWMYLHQSPKEISESVHSILQEKFQSTVSGYVKKNYPAIRRITFHKTWTENTSNPDRIKVYFSYSLTIQDNKADSEMIMDGTADLNRKSGNRWLLTDFKVTDSLVEFSKPLVIKALPDKNTAPSEDPPPEI